MKKLLEALEPLKKKLFLEKCINYFIIGCIIGLSLCTVIILLSKFIFINNFVSKLFTSITLGMRFSIIMILIMMILKKPSIYEVAKVGDSLGFKERFITAVELLNNKDNEAIHQLVLKDAIEKATNANFNTLYKINISNKKYIVLALMLIITICAGFIPVIKVDEIKKQAELQETIDTQLNNINDISKNIENTRLKQQLKELSTELNKASSEAEAIKAIQKTQYKLKQIENELVPKSLKQLGEQLSKNEFTKQLGESLKNMSAKEIKEQLDNLKDKIHNMSDDELKNLSNELKTLTEEIEKDDSLKSLINSLAQSLSSTNLDEIDNALNALETELNKAIDNSDELKKSIDEINKALSNNKADSSKTQPQNNSKSSGNSQGESNNSNSQSSEDNTNSSGGSKRGSGSIENKDTSMRNLENLSEESVYIKGKNNDGGKMEKIEQKMDGKDGQIVLYDKVYNEYRQEALNSLNDNDIPEGMKSLVEDYFSSLEQE